MSGVTSSPGPPEPPARPPVQPRIRYRRAFWISLGLSGALHLLAIALYPNLHLRIPEAGYRPGGAATFATPQGTELVNLRELAPTDPEALRPELREPEPEKPPVLDAPGAGGKPPMEPASPGEGAAGASPRTNAELLRPGDGDLRIWAPIDPERYQPSLEELMEMGLLWELEAFADSAALADEMARRALDWTYKDAEGRRWGVSPGKLHLGDLTLPLPFGFGPPPEGREKIQGRVWEWEEIQRGVGSAAVRESWKERNEAIRRRKEAERKPDTTLTRR